jgi:uncharacterized protein DUF2589
MASDPARELSSIDFQAMLGGPLIAVVNAQAQAAMSSVNFIKAVGFKPGDTTDPRNPQVGDPIYVSFKYPKEVAPFTPAVPAQVTGVNVTTAGAGYSTAPTVTASGGGGSGLTLTAALGTGGSVASISITNPGSGYTSAPTLSIGAPDAGGTQAVATATFQPAQAAQPAQFQQMSLDVPILTMLPIPFIRIEETTIDFNAKINSVEEAKTDESFKIGAELDAKVQYPPAFSIVTVNLKVNTSYQKNTQTGSKVDRTYSMAVHIRAVQDEMPAGMEKILGLLEDAIKAQPAKAPPAVEA